MAQDAILSDPNSLGQIITVIIKALNEIQCYPWKFEARVSKSQFSCAQLFSKSAQFRAIFRHCAQFFGVYRARNCAKVKSTCVGNPSWDLKIDCMEFILHDSLYSWFPATIKIVSFFDKSLNKPFKGYVNAENSIKPWDRHIWKVSGRLYSLFHFG